VKCNKIVKQHYLELWTKQAHSLKEGKLRTYLKIKTNFGYENYLSIIRNRKIPGYSLGKPHLFQRSSRCPYTLLLIELPTPVG
jgi:hypothetical protein